MSRVSPPARFKRERYCYAYDDDNVLLHHPTEDVSTYQLRFQLKLDRSAGGTPVTIGELKRAVHARHLIPLEAIVIVPCSARGTVAPRAQPLSDERVIKYVIDNRIYHDCIVVDEREHFALRFKRVVPRACEVWRDGTVGLDELEDAVVCRCLEFASASGLARFFMCARRCRALSRAAPVWTAARAQYRLSPVTPLTSALAGQLTLWSQNWASYHVTPDLAAGLGLFAVGDFVRSRSGGVRLPHAARQAVARLHATAEEELRAPPRLDAPAPVVRWLRCERTVRKKSYDQEPPSDVDEDEWNDREPTKITVFDDDDKITGGGYGQLDMDCETDLCIRGKANVTFYGSIDLFCDSGNFGYRVHAKLRVEWLDGTRPLPKRKARAAASAKLAKHQPKGAVVLQFFQEHADMGDDEEHTADGPALDRLGSLLVGEEIPRRVTLQLLWRLSCAQFRSTHCMHNYVDASSAFMAFKPCFFHAGAGRDEDRDGAGVEEEEEEEEEDDDEDEDDEDDHDDDDHHHSDDSDDDLGYESPSVETYKMARSKQLAVLDDLTHIRCPADNEAWWRKAANIDFDVDGSPLERPANNGKGKSASTEGSGVPMNKGKGKKRAGADDSEAPAKKPNTSSLDLEVGAPVHARYCSHDSHFYPGVIEEVKRPGEASVKYTVVWDEDGSVTSNIPASRVRAAL